MAYILLAKTELDIEEEDEEIVSELKREKRSPDALPRGSRGGGSRSYRSYRAGARSRGGSSTAGSGKALTPLLRTISGGFILAVMLLFGLFLIH